MTNRKTAVVVLAAGQGTRMKSAMPKVLHALAGRTLIDHVLTTAGALAPDQIVVVVGTGAEAVSRAVAPHRTALQDPPLGTGHAVLAARQALGDFLNGDDSDILILYGDTPLITADTLTRMRSARMAANAPAVVVLGFRPPEPGAYGRIVEGGDGQLEAIVEAKDATPEQMAITLCNSGVFLVDGRHLFDLLDRVGNDNAKGEYYLTDIVELARADGLSCAVVEGRSDEFLGINSRTDLAAAEAVFQARLRARVMEAGVTLIAPETVFLSADTCLGRDVVVGPFVVFGPGVTVGDNVEIRSYSHLEHTNVEAGALIGPFARLRPGADIGPDAHVGNFVEIKNATVEAGAKVNHLTYIGDARIGARTNIGAGTITCNYDGFFKSRTDIGTDAFIGSNTSLIAPVTVGDGAIVGASSAVSRDVPADALAVVRGPSIVREGWAKAFRRRRGAEKATTKR